jgi:hypothetical protein
LPQVCCDLLPDPHLVISHESCHLMTPLLQSVALWSGAIQCSASCVCPVHCGQPTCAWTVCSEVRPSALLCATSLRFSSVSPQRIGHEFVPAGHACRPDLQSGCAVDSLESPHFSSCLRKRTEQRTRSRGRGGTGGVHFSRRLSLAAV